VIAVKMRQEDSPEIRHLQTRNARAIRCTRAPHQPNTNIYYIGRSVDDDRN